MTVSPHIVGVLARAAAEKIGEFPLAERIKIYQALSEALPDDVSRATARELALLFSRAAAMELDFQEQVRIAAPND